MILGRRTAAAAASLLAAGSLVTATAPPSAAAEWPAATAWVPVLVQGAPLVDPAGHSFPEMDVVGDAEHPAAYVYAAPAPGWDDAGYLAFRLRLDVDPRESYGIGPGKWTAQLSTGEDPNAYDMAVTVEGGGAQQIVISHNTDRQCCPDDWPEQEAYTDLVEGATWQVSVADSTTSGNPDYFLDWQVGFTTSLGTLPGADGAVRFLLGTTVMHAGTLGGDIAGAGDSASWEFNGSDLYGRSPVDGNLVHETTPPTAQLDEGPAFVLDRAALSWSGEDPDTGVAGFDLRRRTARWDGRLGEESAVLTRSPVTSLQRSLSRGSTACYTLRAVNGAHMTSAWAGPRCVARPLDQSALRRSSGWTTVEGASYWGGSAWVTRRRGAMLTLADADARRLALVATTCPGCGKVRVSLGGKARGTIDLRSGTTRHRRLLSLPAFGRDSGTLRLEVVSSARKVAIDGAGISAG